MTRRTPRTFSNGSYVIPLQSKHDRSKARLKKKILHTSRIKVVDKTDVKVGHLVCKSQLDA
jgi:hypothetical protein